MDRKWMNTMMRRRSTRIHSRWRKRLWWEKLMKLTKKSSKLSTRDSQVATTTKSTTISLLKIIKCLKKKMRRDRSKLLVTRLSTLTWSQLLRRWALIWIRSRCVNSNSLSFNRTSLTRAKKANMTLRTPLNKNLKSRKTNKVSMAPRSTWETMKTTSRRAMTTWWSISMN